MLKATTLRRVHLQLASLDRWVSFALLCRRQEQQVAIALMRRDRCTIAECLGLWREVIMEHADRVAGVANALEENRKRRALRQWRWRAARCAEKAEIRAKVEQWRWARTVPAVMQWWCDYCLQRQLKSLNKHVAWSHRCKWLQRVAMRSWTIFATACELERRASGIWSFRSLQHCLKLWRAHAVASCLLCGTAWQYSLQRRAFQAMTANWRLRLIAHMWIATRVRRLKMQVLLAWRVSLHTKGSKLGVITLRNSALLTATVWTEWRAVLERCPRQIPMPSGSQGSPSGRVIDKRQVVKPNGLTLFRIMRHVDKENKGELLQHPFGNSSPTSTHLQAPIHSPLAERVFQAMMHV